MEKLLFGIFIKSDIIITGEFGGKISQKYLEGVLRKSLENYWERWSAQRFPAANSEEIP